MYQPQKCLLKAFGLDQILLQIAFALNLIIHRHYLGHSAMPDTGRSDSFECEWSCTLPIWIQGYLARRFSERLSVLSRKICM